MVRIVDALNQLRPEYMWLPLDIAADLEVLCRNKLFEEFDAVDFIAFLIYVLLWGIMFHLKIIREELVI